MKFLDLWRLIDGKTDVDVASEGIIFQKLKYDALDADIPDRTMFSNVDYITAIDYRTIEVGIKEDTE